MSRQSRIVEAGQGTPPCALDYLDYRAYLKDAIQAACLRNARLSQRGIALKAGFKSPHLLGMILAGQRSLTAEKLPLLARALRLSATDQAYLSLLLDLEDARTPTQREELLKRIRVEFLNGIFSQMGNGSDALLRSWVPLAVRELVLLPDFSPDPSWISTRLGISREEAVESFGALRTLGFLVEESGIWKKAEPSLHNFGRFAPMVIAQYNMHVLQKSFEAIHFDNSDRYFESLTIAVPRNLVASLKALVKRFMREVDVLAESQAARDEVWLLNAQLLNLTRARPERGQT